jgi:hypothetical protein
MLDECLTLRASHLIIRALELHKPPIHAEFLEEHFRTDGATIGKGAWDVDWAKTLEEGGDWSVITCDSKRPKGERAKLKGPPLHLILPSRRITGFFMGGKMPNFPGFEKFRAVIYLFPQIHERILSCPAGSRFRIHPTNSRGYEILDWPLKETLHALTVSPPQSPSQLPSPEPPLPSSLPDDEEIQPPGS